MRFGGGQLQTRLVDRLILIPALVVLALFAYFVCWTVFVSFTESRLLPDYTFAGFSQYERLFATDRWWTVMQNLAVYGACLTAGAVAVGYALAVLIDRAARLETVYRTVFLVPLSLSFVVTGIVWHWLLNPDLGIQEGVRALGAAGFTFDWLVRSDRAIYTIALVGVWQQSGMCMVLCLAGLRGIDRNIWRAARLDGIPVWRTYFSVITPMLRPVFFTAFVLLCAMAAKSYDLVVTLTDGGPGFSSDLPARFVTELLARQELGMGAAGACLLLFTVAAVSAPYIYIELLRQRAAR